MEEQHVEELKGQMTGVFTDMFPAADSGSVKQKVADAIDKLTEENKLMSLPEDEYKLLLDYRLWKQSPKVVGGVFHWRKP